MTVSALECEQRFMFFILQVYSNVCDLLATNISKLTNHDSVIGSAMVSE